MEWDSAVVGIRGNVYNWLSFGIVGNSVCRTWESCTLAFPCAVNRVIHDSIASYAHFHNASFVPPGAGLPPLTDFSFRLVAFLSLPPCPLLVGFLPAVCRKPFRFLRREVCPGLFNLHKFLYGFLFRWLLRFAGFSFLPSFLLPLPVMCKPFFLRFQFLRGEKPRFLSCGKFPFLCLALLIPRLLKLL